MTKKKTQQEFIEQAVAIHGDKYDYSNVVYTTSSNKVDIICTVHNTLFSQQANSHLRGCGCPICNDMSGSLKSFTDKARIVHGDKYDYSAAVYRGALKHVDVICPVHGVFKQTPSIHTSGAKCGCPPCAWERNSLAARDTKEQFIEKSVARHGDKYDYTNSDYVSASKNVWIRCKFCNGDFFQRPAIHTQGSGCTICKIRSGFKGSKPGYLYAMTCGDMTKVGITNGLPAARARYISGKFGAEFKVVNERLFDSGYVAHEIETKVLRTLRQSYKNPTARFNGSTECFLNLSPQVLESLILEHMEQHDNN